MKICFKYRDSDKVSLVHNPINYIQTLYAIPVCYQLAPLIVHLKYVDPNYFQANKA